MITSVKNAIEIISCFVDQNKKLGISEIAEQVGKNKSTVHHLVKTLTECGFLMQTEDKKYQLGMKLLQIGIAALKQLDFVTHALPYAEALSKTVKETVHVGVYDQGDVVYVLKKESQQSVRIDTWEGCRKPAYCTGVGKMLLAHQSKYEIQAILSKKMFRYTPHTLTDAETLHSEMDKIRREGFAVDNEEYEIGLFCVAAPIKDELGNVVASISVAGPEFRMKSKRFHKVVQQVYDTAEAISKEMD